MRRSRDSLVRSAAVLLVLNACHTDPYPTGPLGASGPFSSVVPIQLTFNPVVQYYDPRFTQDGKGILYQYSQERRGDDDRCLGLMPDGGGSATWTMCENRLSHADTSDSYGGFALDSTGQLIYLAATATKGKLGLEHVTLWLADTADPLRTRRQLLTLPRAVGNASVDWLSEAAWAGPSEFYARADEFRLWPHQPLGGPSDTLPYGLMVVRGTITAAGASLEPVPGTEGVRSWSLAEQGQSIVFVRHSSPYLLKVPVGGGTPDTVAEIPQPVARYILGVGCAGTICLVTSSTFDPPPANLWGPFDPRGAGTQLPALGLLQRVSLTTGEVSEAASGGGAAFWTWMAVSPASGNALVESGKPPSTTLLLFPGLGR
jgi:hypothetical protein